MILFASTDLRSSSLQRNSFALSTFVERGGVKSYAGPTAYDSGVTSIIPVSVRSRVYCNRADIRDRLRSQNHSARGRRTYFGSDARVTRRIVAAS